MQPFPLAAQEEHRPALGQRLKDVATLIDGGFDTRLFYTGYGGFDTHGTQGQGTGRMPGFGRMLTDEQVAAIVDYVRSL